MFARPVAPLLAVLALAGCATRAVDVAPLPTDGAQFASWSCDALVDELDRVRERATRVAYSVDERGGTNLVALGMGVTVFWPALIAMRPAGADAVELARLKGRDEALMAAQAAHGCPPAPELLPPERAAALPIAVGERLVYDERAARGGPGRELGLRVLALKRTEIEFGVEPWPRFGVGRWAQDRFGNPTPTDPQGLGFVQWRRLLQPDMALGSVLAGDIVDGEERQRGHLRGQVVALGVQTSLGRPFDAAVIELFGDVPDGDHSTRLEGVMVVDRKSGVLVRLELRSANPDFAFRRTLQRIENPPPR